MSDQQFADAFYKKFYSDLPRDQFDQKLGITPPPPSEAQSTIKGAGDTALGLLGPVGQAAKAVVGTETGREAIKNIPSSALEFGKSVVQPILHPVETATAFKNLGMGVLEKTGILPKGEHEKYADAAGQYVMDRYGSGENLRRSIAKDPVGVAADLSMFLTGGGAAAARVPGMVGRVGEVARTAGRAIDPVVAAGKGAKAAGQVGSEVLGGLGAHTGGRPLQIAAEAGAAGGERGQRFLENLRGQVPAEQAVDAARQGLNAMVEQRGKAYRTEMSKLGLLDKPLSFDKIDDALAKATEIKTYKGIDISPTTTEVRKQMTEAIQMWRRLDPKEFHTVEGLDKLKQMLGDIYEGTKPGTPERVAARKIYDGVRQTILAEAPQYKRVMEAYEKASDHIKQMEKSLSLNPNASVDTSLRKLQSVLRDNVNTSFGHRRELADFLVKAGAPHLLERLAGQALQPWLPRGLGRLGMELGAIITGATKATGLLAAGSPRLLGESAYYLGKASPYGVPAGRASFQIGRGARALDSRKMLQEDVREALRDKKGFTEDEIKVLRSATRPNAKSDVMIRARDLLRKKETGGKIGTIPMEPKYQGPN